MQDFLQKNNKNDRAFFRKLEGACEGLVFISETDAPLLPFFGQRTDSVAGEMILQQTRRKSDLPVEEVSFDVFFGRLTAVNDWYGVKEKAMAEKFLGLQKLLEENLRQLKVFKIGKISVDYFAVGIDKNECLVGVTTKAVET